MPMDSIWKPRDDSRRVTALPGVHRQVLACGDNVMVVRIHIEQRVLAWICAAP